MPNKIETIMEGANHDNPEFLHYALLPCHIHENVNVLTYGDDKFLLYANSSGFFKIDFEEVHLKVRGGFPIEELYPPPLWVIFEAQRAFMTRDGRVYVNSAYFRENWKWYLESIPNVLSDCRRLFDGEISESEINLHPKRAF